MTERAEQFDEIDRRAGVDDPAGEPAREAAPEPAPRPASGSEGDVAQAEAAGAGAEDESGADGGLMA